MAAGRTTTLFTLVFLSMMAITAVASEIYYWLDENGVPNYSQEPPAGETPGVSKLNLVDTTSPDYDPEEDRYGVQAQAERMSLLREEIELRREADREQQQNAARQQAVQYREPPRYYSRQILYPLIHHRPPLKPQPPIEQPLPTATLKPPGRAPN